MFWLHFGSENTFSMQNLMDNCHVLSVMFINIKYFTFTFATSLFISSFLFYVFVILHFWKKTFVIKRSVSSACYLEGLCVGLTGRSVCFFCLQMLMDLLKPSANRSPAMPTLVSDSLARIIIAVASSTGREI